MKRQDLGKSDCTLARAAAELMDAWTFVILREILLGNCKFEGIRRQSGMSPRSLSIRLGQLIDRHVLAAHGKDRRLEYGLTQKGKELWPVIVSLKQWGDRYCMPDDAPAAPLTLTHRGHDHPLIVEHVCAACGEPVDAHASDVVLSSHYAERRSRLDAKSGSKSKSY